MDADDHHRMTLDDLWDALFSLVKFERPRRTFSSCSWNVGNYHNHQHLSVHHAIIITITIVTPSSSPDKITLKPYNAALWHKFVPSVILVEPHNQSSLLRMNHNSDVARKFVIDALHWRPHFRTKSPNPALAPDTFTHLQLCSRCCADINRKTVPLHSKRNGSFFSPFAKVFEDATWEEIQCCALANTSVRVHVFRGGYLKSRSNVVNMFNPVAQIAKILPRPVSDSTVVCIKRPYWSPELQNYSKSLKQFVRPLKVYNMLFWLKRNNPLYRDIIIDPHVFKSQPNQCPTPIPLDENTPTDTTSAVRNPHLGLSSITMVTNNSPPVPDITTRLCSHRQSQCYHRRFQSSNSRDTTQPRSRNHLSTEHSN